MSDMIIPASKTVSVRPSFRAVHETHESRQLPPFGTKFGNDSLYSYTSFLFHTGGRRPERRRL
jgi:hypothetical protein